MPATVTPQSGPSAWLVSLAVGRIAGLAWWPLGLSVLISLAAYLLVVLVESVRLRRQASRVRCGRAGRVRGDSRRVRVGALREMVAETDSVADEAGGPDARVSSEPHKRGFASR